MYKGRFLTNLLVGIFGLLILIFMGRLFSFPNLFIRGIIFGFLAKSLIDSLRLLYMALNKKSKE